MRVNKKAVGAKLKTIRETAFPNQPEFVNKSGMLPQIWKPWEKGDSLPRLDMLKVFLETCGWTLSEFFADLESSESKQSAERQIKAVHARLHSRLQELLDAAEPWPTAARINVDAVYDHFQKQKKVR